MERLHPLTKIISLIFLAIYLQYANMLQTLLVLGCLIAVVLYFHAIYFLHMAKRVRWLVIIMMVIYTFNTPGEYVRQWNFEPYPTYEGLQSGILQALRLYSMLAGLALLLASTDRDHLISGLYLLLRPLSIFGRKFDPERFAARLWLTLHYVENPAEKQKHHRLFERFSQFDTDEEVYAPEPGSIYLTATAFTWRDVLAVLLLGLIGICLL